MARETFGRPIDAWSAVKYGIIGGIIAGVLFAVAEMVMAMIQGMSAFVPLQMIGAIMLGPDVLPPAAATATTVFAALVVHLILSAIYGVVLALVASYVPALRSSVWTLTGVAAVYGLLLWIGNFYVIAPIAFPWFAMADPVVQFIAHVFFFGIPLGYYLGRQMARRPATA